MRQPDISVQFSGVEVVFKRQAKSLRAVRHMFIIAAGWPHQQITSSLAFVRILQSKAGQTPALEGTAHRELSTQPSGTAQLSSPPLDLPHYGIGFIDAV